MKIKLSLHNGIGDVVKLFPFVHTLVKNGYDVTYQTCWPNHQLINYFFKGKISIEHWHDRWYHVIDERFDKVINLNHLYQFNDICEWYNFTEHSKMGIYPVIGYMFRVNGIERGHFWPEDLSPSYMNDNPKEETDHIYVFTKSTAGNRTLPDKVVDKLKECYSDIQRVKIDPEFEHKGFLALAINNAKFVVTVDSGPLHIAEACRTPYHALMTINGYDKFLKFYKYGEYTYPNLPCAPCNWHFDTCKEFGDKNYKCQDWFSFDFIKNIIDSKL